MSLRSVGMELRDSEKELEGNHLVISCTINKSSLYNISTHALIDFSATSYAFVDDKFACYHSLLRYRLKIERELEVIDGRPIKSGNIMHMTKISLYINGYEERLPAFTTHLEYYPLVLGKPWLKRHDVFIQFATDTVIFDSPYCLNNCTERVIQIKDITIDLPERIGTAPPLSPLPPMLSVLPTSASAMSPLPASTTLPASPLLPMLPLLPMSPLPPTSPSPATLPPSIAMISATAFQRNTRKRGAYICTFKMTIAEIDRAITHLDRAGVDEGVEEEVRIKALVSEEYHKFLPLFTEVVHNVLPPHRIYDHSILLKEGS